MPHLIVFSHLRWDVRLPAAAAPPVAPGASLPGRLRRGADAIAKARPISSARRRCEGVEVLRPHTPVSAARLSRRPALGAAAADRRLSRRRTRSTTTSSGSTRRWRCRCSATSRPRAVVYDCMDELSAFKNAPRQMRQRETALLKRADLVVDRRPATVRGEARRAIRNVLCLPSAVDAAHYAPRRAQPPTIPPCWHAPSAARPHSGGRAWASSASSTSVSTSIWLPASPTPTRPGRLVMVGPVVKIDPAIAAAASQPSLARPAGLRAPAAARRRLGRVPDAVRAQRIDRVHQSDQDARVHGRRASRSSRRRSTT